jgi:Putative sensor
MMTPSAHSLRRNPVSLAVSPGLWACVWYLLSYRVVGWALFAVTFAAVTAALCLGITLAGLPLLIAAAAVVRGCANVERARLRTVLGTPIAGSYRAAAGDGIMTQVRVRWRDPATWRDIAYLLGLFVPLVVLDSAVLTVWLVFLVGVTLPAWYWAPWQSIHGKNFHGYELGVFPNGPHASPAYGLYIDTLPKALLAAAVSLILFLLFNYALVATARAHATVACGLLRPPEDPLAAAKELLRRPGPLGSSVLNGLS